MNNQPSPLEALDSAISIGLLKGARYPGPGGVVQRQSTPYRQALAQLTSDMLAQERVPEYICRVGGRRGRARLK